MKTNKAVKATATPVYTNEGAKGQSFTPIKELERAVVNCLLYEDSYYESGTDIAKRLAVLVAKSDPYKVAQLAIKARNEFYLRHVPLFLVRELARTKQGAPFVEDALYTVIQRADELSEYVATYQKNKKEPLSAASKRGLARAFCKFNEYQLAKWDSSKAKVRLRHVMRLVHPKPEPYVKVDNTCPCVRKIYMKTRNGKSKYTESRPSATCEDCMGSGEVKPGSRFYKYQKDNQAEVWKRLVNDELKTPDTWETALSAGGDKKAVFTRLINEKKLGGMALLKNLRNCLEAGVSTKLLARAIEENPFDKILPFRFIAAARYAPQLEREIDLAMSRAANTLAKLPGKTVVLVDVSDSMNEALSEKSDLSRMDAACALAVMGVYVAQQDCRVATFSNELVGIAPRTGMALRDAIVNSQSHGGTRLGKALDMAYSDRRFGFIDADRVIVITDEQSRDLVRAPAMIGRPQHRYLINVATDSVGVSATGGWYRITGFSEAIFTYIMEHERLELD